MDLHWDDPLSKKPLTDQEFSNSTPVQSSIATHVQIVHADSETVQLHNLLGTLDLEKSLSSVWRDGDYRTDASNLQKGLPSARRSLAQYQSIPADSS